MQDHELPESWIEVKRAMKDVVSSYKAFIYSVTELCDLLGWSYEYLLTKLMPTRKWDRHKTDNIKIVFSSLEREMKTSIVEREKHRKAMEKKRELMEKFNLTEEEINAMIESLAH